MQNTLHDIPCLGNVCGISEVMLDSRDVKQAKSFWYYNKTSFQVNVHNPLILTLNLACRKEYIWAIYTMCHNHWVNEVQGGNYWQMLLVPWMECSSMLSGHQIFQMMDETCDSYIIDSKWLPMSTDQYKMQYTSSTATRIRYCLIYFSKKIMHQGFIVAVSGAINTEVLKLH